MSDTFLSSDSRSEEEFAVCIGKPMPPHYHIGIFYGAPAKPRFFHFAWYNKLLIQDFDGRYYCVRPPLGQSRLRVLRQICQQVYKASETGVIPYGFTLIEQAFDLETGACLCAGTGEGLTCATFVCAIFARVGAPLIDFPTYQVEQDWKAFRDGIVELMVKTQADFAIPEAHIARLKASTDIRRVRPEDVMTAIRTEAMPLVYDDAVSFRGLMIAELEGELREAAAKH